MGPQGSEQPCGALNGWLPVPKIRRLDYVFAVDWRWLRMCGDIDIGTPQHLFHASVGGIGVPFQLTADGKRLLVNLAEEQGVVPLNVIVNWPAELQKR